LMNRVAELRKAKEPPPPSAETRAAAHEVYEFMRQFDACALEIKAAQTWLQRARADWRHQLLRDLSPDCFSAPGLYHYTDVDNTPAFANAWEARQAAKEMLPRLEWVRNVLARITEAKQFETLPPESQALALTKALFAGHAAIKDRFKNIEAQLGAIEAKLDAHLNPKRRSAVRREAA
jgi:hypothetical protein